LDKHQFLTKLKKRLSFLKREEREDAIRYYQEMIDDAIETGRQEEEFIDGLGTLDAIVASIAAEQGYDLPAKPLPPKPLDEQLRQALMYLVVGVIALAALLPIAAVFSFALSIFVQGLARWLSSFDSSWASVTLYLGQMIFGLGVAIILISLFEYTRPFLTKIERWVQGKMRPKEK